MNEWHLGGYVMCPLATKRLCVMHQQHHHPDHFVSVRIVCVALSIEGYV